MSGELHAYLLLVLVGFLPNEITARCSGGNT